ncbi:MAG: hypothetical protein ACTHZW_03635 [Microbacteriaceae bacterium]
MNGGNMVMVAMEWERIVLAGAWISLMLIYLLGDVIRIFAGHVEVGLIGGQEAADWVWTVASAIMLVPIAMILVSLLVPAEPLRWISIAISAALVIFNLMGMPYKGFFDNMLLVVSFGLNAFVIWIAWAWRPAVIADGLAAG